MKKFIVFIFASFVSLTSFSQIRFIASFNDKSPSSEDLYIINEVKSFIEEKYCLSVQLINEPEFYDGNYIYITPSFTWKKWGEPDVWGNPQLMIRYERVKFEVTYFPKNGDTVTDRYFIGGITVKKKNGELKKKLKDFNFNFPK